MEYTSKETFFYNILIFINWIKDISCTKGMDLVYLNLQLYL